ncbi:GPO family capsid scaffolding protein [Thiothrix subterranea]|uniref:GPO family capsid scaffolding protein n=2 Tax=Thiothrix subterranea TaxID=2735563 RepID=A0ABU0YE17_9GAMM|nr:GPO family capsid scaffolding protein [Thiothrix subterranea]MDQ5771026.1 GPO family capsid scaffolding protein [Thiothrix subterranea]
MGLGVTDSPASLGTGIMKFSTGNRTESAFTEPLEYTDTPTEEQFDTEGQSHQFTKMMDFFTRELNGIRAERDALKAELVQQQAKYADLKSATDTEIEELKQQIPADGYQFRPLTTGNEDTHNVKGWR